jgi:hypothetical protein
MICALAAPPPSAGAHLLCCHRFAALVAPERGPLSEPERQTTLVGGHAYLEHGPLAAFHGALLCST